MANKKDNALLRDAKGRLMKGTPPGPGRPKGSVSPISSVKSIFKDNPEVFESFLKEYMSNPNNTKHIVEMIDGKPKGGEMTIENAVIIPLLGGDSAKDNSDRKAIEAQE